ncbi:MAG: hypothetical protein ACLR06_01065 [Christensenellaceae bacterium]
MVNGDNKYWFENEDKEKSEMPAAEVKGRTCSGSEKRPKRRKARLTPPAQYLPLLRSPLPTIPTKDIINPSFRGAARFPLPISTGKGKSKPCAAAC